MRVGLGRMLLGSVHTIEKNRASGRLFGGKAKRKTRFGSAFSVPTGGSALVYEKVIWFQNSLWFMRKHFGSAHGVEG